MGAGRCCASAAPEIARALTSHNMQSRDRFGSRTFVLLTTAGRAMWTYSYIAESKAEHRDLW